MGAAAAAVAAAAGKAADFVGGLGTDRPLVLEVGRPASFPAAVTHRNRQKVKEHGKSRKAKNLERHTKTKKSRHTNRQRDVTHHTKNRPIRRQGRQAGRHGQTTYVKHIQQ